MRTTMMSANVDRAAKATRSPVFRVFGLGVDPLEMAQRVERLRKDRPERCGLLFDVASRILFVDHLRFEVGWQLEAPERDTGDYLRLDYNLDALEMYLLCTCIDALAAGRETRLGFPEWLAEQRTQINDALSQGVIESSKRYVEVTQRLFTMYRSSAPGLSRSFVAVLMELPACVKEYMADRIVVIKGGFDSHRFRERMQRWWALSVDKRVKWIARRYLWDRRRSSYTHRTKVEGGIRPGILRRVADRGAVPEEETTWNSTSFMSRRDPDTACLTVFMNGSVDEGFLLRAIVAIRALESLLEYEPSDGYLHDFLRYYDTVAASYAFLHELKRNREYLNLLSVPEELPHHRYLGSYQLLMLPTRAGERFLAEFIQPLRLIERFIESYLEQVREFNKQLLHLNNSAEVSLADRYRWERAIDELVEQPGFQQLVGSIRWYDQMIDLAIRGAVQRGEMISAFKCKAPSWPVVWDELRKNVAALPACPSHPQHPHVTTLTHGVINDVLQMSREGITLRSHRSSRTRFVSASVFEAWWRALQDCGQVSMASPPRTEHSRVVGAILAAALPNRLRVVDRSLVLFAG